MPRAHFWICIQGLFPLELERLILCWGLNYVQDRQFNPYAISPAPNGIVSNNWKTKREKWQPLPWKGTRRGQRRDRRRERRRDDDWEEKRREKGKGKGEEGKEGWRRVRLAGQWRDATQAMLFLLRLLLLSTPISWSPGSEHSWMLTAECSQPSLGTFSFPSFHKL